MSECLRSLVSKNEKWHMAVTKNPQLKSVYTFEMNGLVVHLNYECMSLFWKTRSLNEKSFFYAISLLNVDGLNEK